MDSTRKDKDRLREELLAARMRIAELEGAERRLQASEAHFGAFFEKSLVGMAMVDAKGRLIKANPALARLTGYSRRELSGLSYLDITHPEHRAADCEGAACVWRGEASEYESVMRYIRKDGQVLWGRTTVTLVRDEKGAPLYALAVIENITGERRTAEALGSIFDLSLDMLCVSSMERFLRVNPAFERTLGYTEAELLSAPFVDFIHPEDVEPTWLLIEEKLRQGLPAIKFRNRYRRKDGAYRWLEWMTRPVPDQGLLYGVARDVTDRMEIEDLLRESERRFRDILGTVRLIAVVLDLNGRITFANEHLAAVSGYAAPELLGRDWFETLCPGPEVRELFFALRETRSIPPHYENEIVTRSGEHRLIRWNNTLLLDPRGGVIGTASIGEDITKRRRAEDEIQRSLREKDVLLKEVHHRVKNNMQIVSSLLNLQACRIEDQKTRSLFANSQNRILSMALVHELLYKSADFVNIDIRTYVMMLADHLFHSHGVGREAVGLSLDVDPVRLGFDDMVPFGLIVNELLSNALRHAFAPGAGDGRISLALRGLEGGRAELRVSDNGRGLPAWMRPSTPETLGLQLVETLARQLEGTVAVETGDGTAFTVVFMPSVDRPDRMRAS